MQQIRKAAFETNSSSCHSITIAPGDYTPQSIFVPEGEPLRIYPGEFGWEQDTHFDPATKASYCLTYAKERGSSDLLEMLSEVLSEATGAEVLFRPNRNRWNGEDDWGFIDHQSMDVPSGAFVDKATLTRFIFHPESHLVTDNDNH